MGRPDLGPAIGGVARVAPLSWLPLGVRISKFLMDAHLNGAPPRRGPPHPPRGRRMRKRGCQMASRGHIGHHSEKEWWREDFSGLEVGRDGRVTGEVEVASRDANHPPSWPGLGQMETRRQLILLGPAGRFELSPESPFEVSGEERPVIHRPKVIPRTLPTRIRTLVTRLAVIPRTLLTNLID
jgi:hypothetical protein